MRHVQIAAIDIMLLMNVHVFIYWSFRALEPKLRNKFGTDLTTAISVMASSHTHLSSSGECSSGSRSSRSPPFLSVHEYIVHFVGIENSVANQLWHHTQVFLAAKTKIAIGVVQNNELSVLFAVRTILNR